MQLDLDIRTLIERAERLEPSVLSIYLDTDQTQARNLKRGFKVSLGDMLRDVENLIEDAEGQQRFQTAANRARRTVERAPIHGRSMVVFADAADDFLWFRQLPMPVPNLAHWDRKPYIHPLTRMLDEHEPYGVILIERSSARLLRVFLDEVQQKQGIPDPDMPPRPNKSGSDQMWSQKSFQDHADDHLARHVQNVARSAEGLFLEDGIRWVVVLGPEPAAKALKEVLDREKSFEAVRMAPGWLGSDDRQILETTAPIIETIERQTESTLVDQVLTASGKGLRAVVGGADTLAAINRKLVYELVYADSLDLSGSECRDCGALLSASPARCPYCHGAVTAVADMVERAVEHTLQLDARIEVVRGEAARRLLERGGIGALLRAAA